MLILFKYCNKFTIIIGIFPGYFIYGRNWKDDPKVFVNAKDSRNRNHFEREENMGGLIANFKTYQECTII
jgi:hypothetical protein